MLYFRLRPIWQGQKDMAMGWVDWLVLSLCDCTLTGSARPWLTFAKMHPCRGDAMSVNMLCGVIVVKIGTGVPSDRAVWPSNKGNERCGRGRRDL